MSIPRLTIVLGLALVSMLAVVVLRAESTRLNYELSQLDHDAELLQRDIEDRRLGLIRMRSPAQVWAQARKLNAIPSLDDEPDARNQAAGPAPQATPRREPPRKPSAADGKPREKAPAKPAPRPARSGANAKPKKPR